MNRLLAAALIVFPIVAIRAAEPSPLWDNREPIAAYARRLNLPPEKSIDLGNGITLDLVLIPAGQFMMGSPEPQKPKATRTQAEWLFGVGALLFIALIALRFPRYRRMRRISFSLRWLVVLAIAAGLFVGGFVRLQVAKKESREYEQALNVYNALPPSEKSAHLVLIHNPFYMAKFETTQEQYQAIMGVNPSSLKGAKNPVELVSWFDAETFCENVFRKTTLKVRLPFEDEWEYACRAGTSTDFNVGPALDATHANFGKDPRKVLCASVPVRSFQPNAFGLFDMHGNVREWCANMNGSGHANRGGSWLSQPADCRSPARAGHTSADKDSDLGFRVMLPIN